MDSPNYTSNIRISLIVTNVLAALRVIKSLYQNPATGVRKKSEYEKNIGLSEAFLEAVPTTFIIFVSWGKGLGKYLILINSYSDFEFLLI